MTDGFFYGFFAAALLNPGEDESHTRLRLARRGAQQS